MADVYEIIKGINQAAVAASDLSHDARFVEEGEEKVVGLKRERGCAIKDSRVIDGFGVKFSGPNLIITYQSEMPISSVHNTKLNEEIEQMFADIVKFLKKEYRSITKESLSLKEEGDAVATLQNMSKLRTWLQAHKVYTIGGMQDVVAGGAPSDPDLDKNFKSFLDQGGFGSSPKNKHHKRKSE